MAACGTDVTVAMTPETPSSPVFTTSRRTGPANQPGVGDGSGGTVDLINEHGRTRGPGRSVARGAGTLRDVRGDRAHLALEHLECSLRRLSPTCRRVCVLREIGS
jgi:hypothetical protein